VTRRATGDRPADRELIDPQLIPLGGEALCVLGLGSQPPAKRAKHRSASHNSLTGGTHQTRVEAAERLLVGAQLLKRRDRITKNIRSASERLLLASYAGFVGDSANTLAF
jgi:hypothetical protein